jgi:hypothetical protein
MYAETARAVLHQTMCCHSFFSFFSVDNIVHMLIETIEHALIAYPWKQLDSFMHGRGISNPPFLPTISMGRPMDLHR